MSIPAACVLTLALLAQNADPMPAIAPGEFRDWFDQAASSRLIFPEADRDRAVALRYVFVSGLANERMPRYFAQNIAALHALGVPSTSIHEIHPSSDASFAANLARIRDGFHQAAAAGPEPLVVVAHSRGACDSLAFALRDPRFVRDHIAALFLVQGPFGGSGLADYVVGDGVPMDRAMIPRARLVAKVVGGIERSSIRRGRNGGLIDLTRDSSRDFWRRELKDHAKAIPIVGPRTYFVEAAVEPSQQRLLRKPMARYLDAYYGPNDGVVAVADQSLEGLGTRLGPLDVGHTDLTHRFPAARAQPRLRHALILAVARAVGREAPRDPAKPEPR